MPTRGPNVSAYFWHHILKGLIAFNLVLKPKTGAVNEPKRKLWLRSGLNKAKAFVQAE